MGRSLKLYLIPLLMLLAVTVPHLEQGDFRRDTGRYAAVGLYMWTDGSLAAPYLNPETPYFNKPPLALWVHGFFLKTFGVHLVTARVPSILAALGVVIFSMLAVRQFASRSEAVVSGIVLALTYEFFRRTREISLDFWQLFFLMAAVYAVAVGIRKNCKWAVIGSGIRYSLSDLPIKSADGAGSANEIKEEIANCIGTGAHPWTGLGTGWRAAVGRATRMLNTFRLAERFRRYYAGGVIAAR